MERLVKSFKIPASAVALGLMLTLTGCKTTYKVDQNLVQQFKTEQPKEDQTYVYMIRGSNFQGGARGAWIAVNDKVVADLSNGSHTLLKLDSGINSLHLVQGLAGFGYAKIDNRPGETVFMSIDYSTGKTTEIDYDLGASMVMRTKYKPELESPRKNDAYDNLLANPSLLGFDIMQDGKNPMKPDDEHAVINFFRMEKLIGSVPFDIWDEDGFVASTRVGQYFQVKVKPGKHKYIALSERYSVLEANVEAGKEYFVEFDVDMGWNQAHVQILPLDAEEDKKTISKWQNKARLKVVNQDVLNSNEFKTRVEMAKTYLAPKFKAANSKELAQRVMNPENGRL